MARESPPSTRYAAAGVSNKAVYATTNRKPGKRKRAGEGREREVREFSTGLWPRQPSERERQKQEQEPPHAFAVYCPRYTAARTHKSFYDLSLKTDFMRK